MSTKLSVTSLAMLAVGHGVTAPAQAAPWLAPGDPKARYVIQKLADRGELNRGVTTWPVMWPSISSGTPSQPSAGGHRGYLHSLEQRQTRRGVSGDVYMDGRSEAGFFRDFEAAPREQGEIGGRVEWQAEHWAVRLSPSYVVDPEDDESVRLDNSYLAGFAGNWVLGVGALDRWWGPGWGSSLILSTNARPMPALWFNRRNASAPETTWLRWIGPWQLTGLLGQYESDRAVPEARLIGLRATFRPLSGLDVGFSRAIMWGGEGRSESLSSLWDALRGDDNGDAEGQDTTEDPSNQLASLDVRYGFALGSQTLGLYGQMMGEDEAGLFPAKKSWLFGIDGTTALAGGEQQWFLEYANTLADDVLGTAVPNVSYEHGTYRSGYRYYGRNLASTLDSDARGLVLGGYHFFSGGSTFGLTLTAVDLNVDGTNRVEVVSDDIFYNVPNRQQTVTHTKASFGTGFLRGWLSLQAQFTDRALELVGGERNQWSVGASWQYRLGQGYD